MHFDEDPSDLPLRREVRIWIEQHLPENIRSKADGFQPLANDDIGR